MMQAKRGTKEERIAFYIDHDKLLEHCNHLMGGDLGQEGRTVVDDARARFDYSPKTFSRDIMSSLLRGWRKWRKEGGTGR